MIRAKPFHFSGALGIFVPYSGVIQVLLYNIFKKCVKTALPVFDIPDSFFEVLIRHPDMGKVQNTLIFSYYLVVNLPG